jgi:hypothetical protein
MKRLNRLSTAGAALLALSVLTVAAPPALADHNLYPPGWNLPPDPNLPKPMFDFRAGWGWDDYQRYWPDQTERGASPKSRPFQPGPTFYTMTPGGHRYHQQSQ